MSFLRAKPIGVMQMIDQGEQDDKIIAVHADDPEFRDYDDISQLPKHRLAEIRRCVLQLEEQSVHISHKQFMVGIIIQSNFQITKLYTYAAARAAVVCQPVTTVCNHDPWKACCICDM